MKLILTFWKQVWTISEKFDLICSCNAWCNIGFSFWYEAWIPASSFWNIDKSEYVWVCLVLQNMMQFQILFLVLYIHIEHWIFFQHSVNKFEQLWTILILFDVIEHGAISEFLFCIVHTFKHWFLIWYSVKLPSWNMFEIVCYCITWCNYILVQILCTEHNWELNLDSTLCKFKKFVQFWSCLCLWSMWYITFILKISVSDWLPDLKMSYGF